VESGHHRGRCPTFRKDDAGLFANRAEEILVARASLHAYWTHSERTIRVSLSFRFQYIDEKILTDIMFKTTAAFVVDPGLRTMASLVNTV
jgi:hypothetical protein